MVSFHPDGFWVERESKGLKPDKGYGWCPGCCEPITKEESEEILCFNCLKEEGLLKEETQMKKILVTKEQGTSLFYISKNSFSFNMDRHMSKEGWIKHTALNDLTLEELATALLIGWEVKKSPEEQIQELYEAYAEDRDSGDYDRIFTGRAGCEAIEVVGNILGIIVPGINDNKGAYKI